MLTSFQGQKDDWEAYQAFLKMGLVPGRLIFGKVSGSRSHNCHHEKSDRDFMGVYLCRTSEVLSLTPPPDGVDHDTADGGWEPVDKVANPDYAFYEVKKFCDLLLKGNPNVVELLYTNRLCDWGREWAQLREHRKKFLTQTVVKHYLGYLQGQMKRLEGALKTQGYKEKWAYHAMRLLKDCERIARGDEPVVWKEGPERDLLLKIRSLETPWVEVHGMLTEGIYEIDNSKPWNCPEEPDKVMLNDWLVGLRRDNW